MKYLRLFPSVSIRDAVLAEVEHSVLSYVEGEGMLITMGECNPVMDYSIPFYVENITNTAETLQIIDFRDDQPLYMEIPFEYSIDGTTWNSLGTTGATPLTRTLQPGDKVYLRATSNSLNRSYADGIRVRGTSKVGGNIMSLLYGSTFTGNETIFPSNSYTYQFCKLFNQNQTLVDASELGLPATALTEGCYYEMFSDCTALTTAPQILPATTLAEMCYAYMFSSCTALTTAPRILQATTLATACCMYMFSGCTSLVTTPALPATVLAEDCYDEMFGGCESLTTAPALPATTLAQACYTCMFRGCTSLTSAPALPATTLADRCYQNMFCECTSLITPPTLPATTLAEGCYSGMFYLCTSLTTVPALPATTLAKDCYSEMFRVCTSLTLSDIPILPATTLAENCYTDMFKPISIDQNDFESWCSQHIAANNYDPNVHGYPVQVSSGGGDIVK